MNELLSTIDFIDFNGYTLKEEFDYEEKKHTAETLQLYNQGFELEQYGNLGDEDYYEGISMSDGLPYFQFYIDGNTIYIGMEGKEAGLPV